ncbi:unnamed protein product [Macrosiphum euphorbiae]|uniref:Uncharacterized protein n=1 Tax=Macrosiphum euphorbiae TaxID=13131 RepID=A0AAV0X5U3_9HEMI|nr:unnamed protein product [Macrosiphum euphorbiae]
MVACDGYSSNIHGNLKIHRDIDSSELNTPKNIFDVVVYSNPNWNNINNYSGDQRGRGLRRQTYMAQYNNY